MLLRNKITGRFEEQRIRLQNAETDYKRYQELLKGEAVTP